jgi:hypothetical protein
MAEKRARHILAGVVLSHLGITIVHGAAHAGADVPTTTAGTLFIALVIIAGPVAGLWLSRSHPFAGGWVVATAMAGALVFGLVNHFVVIGPDHVSHVAQPWRLLFATTAALLVIAEATGTGAGVWYATRPRETPT